LAVMLIRADANPQIGAGHVMRCLALAQAWQDEGGRTVFLMAPGAAAIEKILRTENMEIQLLESPIATLDDAAETANSANSLGADWIVLDGYRFDQGYRRYLITQHPNLLWIDDFGAFGDSCAKMVLNTEINASRAMYPGRADSTRLLLGPRYLLLRREFCKAPRRTVDVPEIASKILVTLGGADLENITARVLTSILAIGRELDVTVVVGPANPHRKELERQIESLPLKVQIVEDPDLPSLMLTADLAVSGAGVTCWELAFMSVPLVLVAVAANQEPTLREFGRRGIAIDAGRVAEFNAETTTEIIRGAVGNPVVRRNMSERARDLIDGRGATRVIESLRLCARNAY
jgi:UDP-2,4-diacetamido-2,4,6-trideoxy-beta-L-altropyranose hydrolase